MRVHVLLNTLTFRKRKECVAAQAAIASIGNDCHGVALVHYIARAASELYQFSRARGDDIAFG